MDRHLTPYEKGQAEAWLSPVTRNPYDRDSDGEREWLMGWQDAKDKRIAELEAALGLIASCETQCDGDVVDIARRALGTQ